MVFLVFQLHTRILNHFPPIPPSPVILFRPASLCRRAIADAPFLGLSRRHHDPSNTSDTVNRPATFWLSSVREGLRRCSSSPIVLPSAIAAKAVLAVPVPVRSLARLKSRRSMPVRRHSTDPGGVLPAPLSRSMDDDMFGAELEAAVAADRPGPLLGVSPPAPPLRSAAAVAAARRSETGLGLEDRGAVRLGGTGGRGSIMLASVRSEPPRRRGRA